MHCRSWAIGRGQSGAQRRAFEAQLGALDCALQQHGGPFLLGPRVSLVGCTVHFAAVHAVALDYFG